MKKVILNLNLLKRKHFTYNNFIMSNIKEDYLT